VGKDINSDREVIFDRLRDDGRATLRLNSLQLKMRSQVLDKIRSGAYPLESPPCPICDGADFRKLAEKDRYGIPQPVVACRACGLVQSRPRMTQAAYDEFYNVEYRKLYVGKETASGDFFRREVSAGKKIISYLSGAGTGDILRRDPALVVEVGCGAGGILLPFRERGCRVLGLDLGEEYLALGRRKYGLDLRRGTLDASLLPRKADLIIYNHVIEHILDPIAELNRARNCLAAGGAIYIAVPGVKWLYNSYRMDFLRLLQNAHVWHFTLTTLSNLCRKAGLHVTSGEERVQMIVEPGDVSRQPENDFPAVIEYLIGVEGERKKLGQRAVILLQTLPFREKLARVAGILRIKPLLKRLVFNREPPKLKSRKPDERGSPRPKK